MEACILREEIFVRATRSRRWPNHLDLSQSGAIFMALSNSRPFTPRIASEHPHAKMESNFHFISSTSHPLHFLSRNWISVIYTQDPVGFKVTPSRVVCISRRLNFVEGASTVSENWKYQKIPCHQGKPFPKISRKSDKCQEILSASRIFQKCVSVYWICKKKTQGPTLFCKENKAQKFNKIMPLSISLLSIFHRHT